MYLFECWIFLISAEGTRLWHEDPGYWWRIQWFWASVETGTACMSLICVPFLNIIHLIKAFLSCLFDQVYSIVRPLLEAYFPSASGMSVIAEPGNFFVFSSFTLAVNVIGKKAVYRDLYSSTHGESHHIWDIYGIWCICLIFSLCHLHFQMSWPQTMHQNLCITWMTVFMDLSWGSCLEMSSPRHLSTR